MRPDAGIPTGLAHFNTLFTREQHWNLGQIGVMIACQSLAESPCDLLDKSHHKDAYRGRGYCGCAWGLWELALCLKRRGDRDPIDDRGGNSRFPGGAGRVRSLRVRRPRNESFTGFGNASFAVIAAVISSLISPANIFDPAECSLREWWVGSVYPERRRQS